MTQAAFERLENLQRIGIKLGLHNIGRLLEALGSPEKSWPSVLVAGTNGKGSVGAMLERILREHGIRTGHYTSPHLLQVRERIRVQGESIPEEELGSALESVFEAVDQCLSRGILDSNPTYFETLTAAACVHFQRAGVQFAVIEVGLGGRFDATNAISQSLSVITNIDFDHQELLGHSLTQIAAEKAGILKRNVPLVTGIISPDAARVIQETAEKESCEVRALSGDWIRDLKLEAGFPVFQFEPWQSPVRVSLRGRHQAVNAGVALLAADALAGAGVPLSRAVSLSALENVAWPGRLDLISETPPVLVDCAHNPNGVDSLAAFLREQGWERVILLFTAMRDKNIAVMLNRIAQCADTVFLTRVEPSQRCARYEELAGACLTARLPFVYKEDPAVAFRLALDEAARKQLPLVVFGSVYLIGAVFQISGRKI